MTDAPPPSTPPATARGVPLIPTLVVAAAVAAMVALGVWQWNKRAWKTGLIARYSHAQAMNADVPWPRSKAAMAHDLFRYSGFTCARVIGMRGTAKSNMHGETGLGWIAECDLDGGGRGEVALGWAPPPKEYRWSGGAVRGVIGPGDKYGGVLYAAQSPPGLVPLAIPDPKEAYATSPEGHLAYAIQWWLFAATAVVIYVLALRKRSLER